MKRLWSLPIQTIQSVQGTTIQTGPPAKKKGKAGGNPKKSINYKYLFSPLSIQSTNNLSYFANLEGSCLWKQHDQPLHKRQWRL